MRISYYSKPRTPAYQKWTGDPPPFYWQGGAHMRFRPTFRIYPAKNEAPADRGWGIYLCTLAGDPAAFDNLSRQRENDVIIAGEIDGYTENKLYEGVGTWELKHSTSKKTGQTYSEWQIKIESVVLAEAQTKPEIIELLSEVKGLSTARIAKLFKWAASIATELELLQLMDTVGSACFAQAGIKLKDEQRDDIWSTYYALRADRETFNLLGLCKIVGTPRKDIMAAWGNKLREGMQRTPEKLLDIDDVGFVKAHTVWMACGLAPNDLRVVAAGLKYTLDQISNEGHCWADLPATLSAAAGHLSLPSLPGDWYREHYEDKPAIQRLIYIDEYGNIWSRRIYDAECALALRLTQLNAATPLLNDEQLTRAILLVDDMIIRGEEPLDPSQREAVLGVLAHNVSVLTGSAGTGKTTIIRTAIKLLNALGIPDVTLCAFTGMAAENASEKTGHPGITIHSAIKYVPGQRPMHNLENPIVTRAVIVDEMSMGELTLINNLAQATPVGALFVMVGDEWQLPPIGPGAILRDVIAAEVFPAYRLTKTYRQDPNSHLLELFEAVKAKKPLLIADVNGQMLYHDIDMVKMREPEEIKDWLLKRYQIVLHQLGADTPNRFKAITYRKGTKTPVPNDYSENPKQEWNDGGVMALNRWIIEAFYAPDSRQVTYKSMGTVYAPGQRCLWLKNTYDKTEYPMWNGKEFDFTRIWVENEDGTDYTYGRIATKIGGEIKEFDIRMKDFDGCWMHGVSVTIHKYQGRECKEIVFVIRPGDRRRLTVAAVYTALSRASQKISVIGDIDALYEAVDDHDYRQTRLTDRLIELMADRIVTIAA